MAAELGGILRTVTKELGSLLAPEAKLLWNLNADLAHLHRRLVTVQKLLEDAEQQCLESKLAEHWLRRLRNVAYDIEDTPRDYRAACSKFEESDLLAKGICQTSRE